MLPRQVVPRHRQESNKHENPAASDLGGRDVRNDLPVIACWVGAWGLGACHSVSKPQAAWRIVCEPLSVFSVCKPASTVGPIDETAYTTMTIELFVNQACINQARRTIPSKGDRGKNCPVGAALTNAGVEFRTVATGWIAFGIGDNSIHKELPEPVRSFIADFDRGRAAEPFRFSLEVPDAMVQLSAPSSVASDRHLCSHTRLSDEETTL